MRVKELRRELIGQIFNFVELDNFMMEKGFYTTFDSGIDFDEIADSGSIVYQASDEDEYAHIELKSLGDFNGCNTEIKIKAIWVE